MNRVQLKSATASYLRAGLAAVVALYMSGVTDWKLLANAALAGILGPLLKALNPKDTAYGIVK